MKQVLKSLKTFAIVFSGWAVFILGVIMLPAPGPGVLVMFAGIAILANHYHWARRLRDKIRGRVHRATVYSVSTKLRILFSGISALIIIGAGAWVFTDPTIPSFVPYFTIPYVSLEVGPKIPHAGAFSGGVMMGSGVLALVILIFAVVKYSGLEPDESLSEEFIEELETKRERAS